MCCGSCSSCCFGSRTIIISSSNISNSCGSNCDGILVVVLVVVVVVVAVVIFVLEVVQVASLKV